MPDQPPPAPGLLLQEIGDHPHVSKVIQSWGLLCRSALALLLHKSRHVEHGRSNGYNTYVEQHEGPLCSRAMTVLQDCNSLGSLALSPSTRLLYSNAHTEIMRRALTASLGQQVTFSGRGV